MDRIEKAIAAVVVACIFLIIFSAYQTSNYIKQNECTKTGDINVEYVYIYNHATKTSLPHPQTKYEYYCAANNKTVWF